MTRAARMILRLLRFHGSQTRSQMVWWLGHFNITAGQTIYAARILASEGKIQPDLAREVHRGHLSRTWRARA